MNKFEILLLYKKRNQELFFEAKNIYDCKGHKIGAYIRLVKTYICIHIIIIIFTEWSFAAWR